VGPGRLGESVPNARFDPTCAATVQGVDDSTRDREAAAHAVIGFACHWNRPAPATWSGTPWRLRDALTRVAPVVDLGAELPAPVRAALKVTHVRRTGGAWSSSWRYGRVTRGLVARQVRRATARLRPDVVLEIQDLARTTRPTLVLQDLSYALLLERFGPDGVPHFRALGRRRIDALRRDQERVYAGAAALLPMSRWLADSLVAHGVPADRVHVVPPGVAAPVPVGTRVPRRHRGPTARLLFVGRDFDTKGGAQVVAAAELLRAHRPVTLTVAGPQRWPLRGGVPDGVEFLGPVPHERVGELMDQHDLFVMPSVMEGFGMVFAEALQRGLPCVGRDDCAMPEIIDPVAGGRLVRSADPADLADEIAAALDDDDLYAACAAAADERRAYYSWHRAATDVVRIADAVWGAA